MFIVYIVNRYVVIAVIVQQSTHAHNFTKFLYFVKMIALHVNVMLKNIKWLCAKEQTVKKMEDHHNTSIQINKFVFNKIN